MFGEAVRNIGLMKDGQELGDVERQGSGRTFQREAPLQKNSNFDSDFVLGAASSAAVVAGTKVEVAMAEGLALAAVL